MSLRVSRWLLPVPIPKSWNWTASLSTSSPLLCIVIRSAEICYVQSNAVYDADPRERLYGGLNCDEIDTQPAAMRGKSLFLKIEHTAQPYFPFKSSTPPASRSTRATIPTIS